MRLEVTRKSDLAVRALRALARLDPGMRAKGPLLADLVGTKYPDVRDYYRASIRESVGFEVEI